jgi:hypothetical protein
MEPHAQHSRPPAGTVVVLWISLLAGPLLVLASQWGAYALVPGACARRDSLFVHLVHGLALLLVAGCFLAGHRAWTRTGGGAPDESPAPQHRARFMAVSAMALSAFSALVVVWFWVEDVYFWPCLPCAEHPIATERRGATRPPSSHRHPSPVTRHRPPSLVPRPPSPVTCHLSPVTCHLSPVTCNLAHPPYGVSTTLMHPSFLS